MNVSKFILVALFLFSTGNIFGQKNNAKIDGSEPFIIKYDLAEIYKDGDLFSKEFEMDIKVFFNPSMEKNSGEFSIYVDGESESVKINNIRKVIKDGETFYMGNDINSKEIFYVWSFEYFLHSNGVEIVQFTKK